MNKKIISTLVVSLFALTSAASFAMTKPEYNAAKDTVSATYKSAKDACKVLAGNAKDICMAEAKGVEKVDKADLEARYNPKEKNQNALRMAKADAAYDVAKEKCDDKAGNDKDVCIKEAKSAHVTAKSNATVAKKVTNAVVDAKDDRMNAEYKVAIEKCDVLAGDTKATCVANAKTKYNKS